MKPFLCIGHRGASGHEPENTLLSMRAALQMGVDGVEFDVQRIEDQLIVFHDSRLERTTNGRGYLRRKTFAQLRALDAGKGERIPTLQEVAGEIDRRAMLNIELKGRHTAQPVAALLDELVACCGWQPEQFLVSSFNRRELTAFRAATSRIPVGILLNRPSRISNWLRSARALHATSVHPPVRFTTPKLVEKAHAAGLKVYVYTVNTATSIARMRAIGVDGVFTDFPELCAF
jgi:glycerophosphoryl diester phosphodiesterase